MQRAHSCDAVLNCNSDTISLHIQLQDGCSVCVPYEAGTGSSDLHAEIHRLQITDQFLIEVEAGPQWQQENPQPPGRAATCYPGVPDNDDNACESAGMVAGELVECIRST